MPCTEWPSQTVSTLVFYLAKVGCEMNPSILPYLQTFPSIAVYVCMWRTIPVC